MFLTAIGLLFTLIGVILFFDRGFLAIGNVRHPARVLKQPMPSSQKN